ncbi:MAG: aminotransferase class V-fold PLP-dependent enzyme, partial [Kofleriaceae bacterium]|nr:aminotransferase class V-fold PLP-dependent enzyme [Kofleriaceae bacterium]
MTTIYLDNAASTRPSDAVIELMARVMREAWGNPASAHPAGAAARAHLATARDRVLAAIGDPAGAAGELIWTSGGSEADALAILGAARARGRGVVVLSALEHHAVARSAALLGDGFEVRVVPATAAGTVDVAAMTDAITADTAVVALMRVHNELGTLQPVAEIAAAARRRAPGAHVHCDAVQALGKIAVDVAALGVDSAAFAGHKLHGPKGVGALWLRRDARIEPLWGGGGQQGGLRSGTQDAPSAAGMGQAVA